MYEKIYTIGCFDFFHQGHINLFKNMRLYGKKLYVGIHDDFSLEKLKKLTKNQHESLNIRINKLKPYVDYIFIIPSTNPSQYLENIINKNDNMINSCYIRGDDMIDFPGKQIIINRISLMYLPYTKGISSTYIRKQKLLK